MDCQSIKINLLPDKPKRKTKTKSFAVAICAAIITLTMSTAGMLFVYSHIALACHGVINIVKATNPSGSTQQFSFTSTVSGANNFSLSNGQTKQLSFAGEGNYSITENQISGWQLTSIVCQTSYAYNVDLANRKVVINANNDGSATCTFTNTKIAYCGDGIKNNEEQCDGTDGVSVHQFCSADCTITNLPYCGDGIKNGAEECDGSDGVDVHQTCSGTCAIINVPYCGDKIKNGDEQCDGTDGVGAHQSCSDTCATIDLPYCGNSVVDSGEGCDDGNTNNEDSCRNNCTLPTCGDGIQDSGELCDDGNTNNLDSCRNNCTVPTCGDGILDTDEACDDHNNASNDGCSATCTIERGSLTVCKYYDVNKNGSYDIGTDTPLTWDITITAPDSATTTVQTNSETGCYQLSDLPYGTYQVTEETKNGWIKSFPNENPATAIIDATSTSPQITFLNYESIPGPNYGSIQVCKLIDVDGLASTTADQYAATSSVWSFDLVSISGTSTQATAIGNNCVTYNELSAGDYQAQEEAQNGWQLIDPANNKVNINLSSGENKTINFVNSQIVVPTGSIAGYKYNDANNNGVVESGEQPMSGWTIELIRCPYSPLATSAIQFLPNGNWHNVSTGTEPITGQCTVVATTTTDGTGHYQFAGLTTGDYGIAEIAQSNWTQTYPASSTFYYFYLDTSENKTSINFANHKPGEVTQPRCGDSRIDSGEQCDDGNNTNGDGCNSTCQIERSSGGGGGGYIYNFSLSNTSVTENNCEIIVTWGTNSAATSRVYYDTTPHSTTTMPSGAYAYSVIDDVNKVTGHNVKIIGLKPNTTYYFRAYSQAASTQYSQEIAYKTGGEQCSTVTVKGEEGAPQLAITKMVNTDFANAGQKGIEYLITVNNKGNLTAYGVKLKDLLPSGLQYEDIKDYERSWDLGDMAPDASKAVTYKINVDANAKPLTYINTATVTATNQIKPLSANAKLEVRAVKVLAVTGFSLVEFIVMISTFISLISLSVFFRRKIVSNED